MHYYSKKEDQFQKKQLLNTSKNSEVLAEIEKFEAENSSWLADYAEYMAIKESFGYQSLNHWDEDIKRGEQQARERYRAELKRQYQILYCNSILLL